MVVRIDLVEDFSRSLSELNDMLLVSVDQKDFVYRGIVRDAQLFSFLRSSEVLRTFIMHMHTENCDDQYVSDTESAVVNLCMIDMIDDEQAKDILDQLDLAEFLALDRSWLDQEDDRRLFDGGIRNIFSYCKGMSRLLNEVSSQCTLIDHEEKDDQGH